MSSTFDPYYQWLGIPPHEQPPDHYRLLGLARYEANPDVIESAADRQMAHVRTHQSGKHAEASQRLLNEIAAARLCLHSADKKAAYDAALKASEKSAAQEKPLKRAEPIADAPAPRPPARTTAGIGIGGRRRESPPTDVGRRQESPPTSLAPLLVIAAGGVVVLLLLLVVGGGMMWLLFSSDLASPMTADARGATDPIVTNDSPPPAAIPRSEPVVSNPPPPPPVIHNRNNPPGPRFPGPSGPAPVVLNPNRPSGPRFPGPSGPAPVILNPNRPPDTTRPNDPPAPAPEPEPEPATVAGFFPPEPADTRLPVPDESDREERREQIDELFEIGKAVRFDEKVAVARELLKTGRETKSDTAARYALLNMAREVASGAGDVRLALEAVKDIDTQFQIDGDIVRFQSVSAAAEASVPTSHRDAVVVEGMKLVDRLFQQDRYVEAAKLITSLQAVARKNRDPKQSAALAAQQRLGSELFRTYRDAQPSIEKLKADPADTAAAAAAGRYFTFAKGDWQLGLPMLAAGDDEELKKLAEQEMAVPTDADARKELAAAWRESAKKFTGIQADRQNARAATWFKRIEGSLTGLAKIEVQKQIAEIGELEVDGGQPYRAPAKVATVARPSPPSTSNPPPSEPDGAVAIDLLALIDPEKNGVLGAWKKVGDALVTPRLADSARLEIPFHPPAEYELEMDVTRKLAGNELMVGLVYQGKQCSVGIDRYSQSVSDLLVGLPNNQHRSPAVNRRRGVLADGKRIKLKYVVRKQQIQVLVDGEELLNYQGDADWEGMIHSWAIPDKQALMIGAWWSEFQIHSIKLTPLKE